MTTAADLTGWPQDAGTIEVGKFADLIAAHGGLLTDITGLQRARFVMKGVV
jgi:imidazolonepropionase-like amidohydrolase